MLFLDPNPASTDVTALVMDLAINLNTVNFKYLFLNKVIQSIRIKK